MKLPMRQHQKEYIYDPVVDYVDRHKLLPPSTERPYQVLGLSTSAGKTFTANEHLVEYYINNGLCFVFTSRLTAGIDEVSKRISELHPTTPLFVSKAVAGCSTDPYHFIKNAPVHSDDPFVMVCTPEYLHSQQHGFSDWIIEHNKKVVIMSDEGHNGFMCPNKESTKQDHGYFIGGYTAEWYNMKKHIPTVAWFLISATPLNSTMDHPDYELLSEFYDREILCQYQKRVKSITMVRGLREQYTGTAESFFDFDNDDNSEFIVDTDNTLKDLMLLGHQHNAQEQQWLRQVESQYGFPSAQPTTLVQSATSEDAEKDYMYLGSNTVINISDRKEVYNQGWSVHKYSSQELIDIINDQNNESVCMVANQSVGEAINVHGATRLYSYHEKKSIKSADVTHKVEQTQGRMIRWPKVDGIHNWYDVYRYKAKRVAEGVPEDIIDKWIDIVFTYDVFVSSHLNVERGLVAFYDKHTYRPAEWDEYLSRIETAVQEEIRLAAAEDHNVIDLAKRKKYGAAWAIPSAQKGAMEYRNYKKNECEHCSKVEIDDQEVPACKIPVVLGDCTEKDYFDSLHVHHINGRENLDTMNHTENLITVCGAAHRRLDREYEETKKRLTQN